MKGAEVVKVGRGDRAEARVFTLVELPDVQWVGTAGQGRQHNGSGDVTRMLSSWLNAAE